MNIWEVTLVIVFLIVFGTMQLTLNKILEKLDSIDNKLGYVNRKVRDDE